MPLITILKLEKHNIKTLSDFETKLQACKCSSHNKNENKHNSIDSAMSKEYQQKARHGKHEKKQNTGMETIFSRTCISKNHVHQWNGHANIMQAGIISIQLESTSFCHAFVTISTRRKLGF